MLQKLVCKIMSPERYYGVALFLMDHLVLSDLDAVILMSRLFGKVDTATYTKLWTFSEENFRAELELLGKKVDSAAYLDLREALRYVDDEIKVCPVCNRLQIMRSDKGWKRGDPSVCVQNCGYSLH